MLSRGRAPRVWNLAGVDVRAVSVAGLETCIELPSRRIAFDIGRCPHTAIAMERVFFTHAHVDHLGGLAHHVASRDLFGMRPPTYYVPAPVLDDVLALLDAWRRLDRAALPCEVVPLRAGDRVDVGKGGFVEAFAVSHRVPSLGYALIRRVQRLREDLQGLPGEEIRARRAAGEEVTRAEERVEVAFCGDTTIRVVERQPLVRRARLLVLECTFVEPEHLDRAAPTGHVHLDQIAERAHLFADNERVLLTHFSQRYAPKRVRQLLDERLPPELRAKVVPLLEGGPEDH